jgi:hypothetical protein
MKRSIPACTLALLIMGGAATPAAGQVGFTLGGGATVPVGDFGDVAATGWMAMAGVRLGLPLLPVGFRAEGLYGQNPHDGAATDKTVLYGAMANVIFQIGPPLVPVKPYLIGGVGYLNHKFSPGNSGLPEADEWKPVFGGGVGVNVSLVMVGIFAEVRYLRRDDTSFFPIMAGLRLGG